LNPTIIFELCAESLDACLCAKPGGADRIELCTQLHLGGLTPAHELTVQSVQQSGLPIHILLRPHDQGYVYTYDEFKSLCDEIDFCREAGVAGVVLGILLPDNRIDVARLQTMVSLAGPMEVTFHRAFDAAPNIDIDDALEDVIAAGCKRILTSGGKPDVLTGADALARLVTRAAGRIAIACGGGLRMENAQAVRQISGATHFHSSLATPPVMKSAEDATALKSRIHAMVQLLHES